MLNQEDDRFDERSFNLGPYQYQGSSIGGERTYHGIQNLKLCFDLGVGALSTTNLNIVCISHGHADHCGGLIPHLWRRDVRRLPMATYFAQPEDAQLLQEIVNVSCRLSRAKLVENVLRPMTDQPVELSSRLVLTKFNSVHRVPCIGYLVSERRGKLLPEYRQLSPQEVRDLKNSGVQVQQEVLSPEIAYTGDTSIEVFDLNPFLLQTRFLITECTGLDDKMDPDKVRKVGHIHLDHLVELFRDRPFEGEKLVLGHFSARYSREYCLRMVQARLPPDILAKTIII